MVAAQQLQNALSAENQALTGDPTAAQQAAGALRQAFGALKQMAAYDGGVGPAGANPASSPSGWTDHPGGIRPGPTSAGAPPKAVTALGISPQTWRNLGPLARQHLLDTARQSIPPGYRHMVRDYYVRLAQMMQK